MTVNLLQAVIEVIGESDNEIGGLRITRLTVVAVQGATSVTVESTLNWATSGKVSIAGQVYSYTGITITTITGITHLRGLDVITGTRVIHPVESEVIDLNKNFSAIDLVRRAMLTDFAEGSDLDAIGRNLAVNRLPFVDSDTTFRGIIQALAYNPRGTIFGLELALTAIVGTGNFTITEDLINSPNTVFITLTGDLALTTVSTGKAFINGGELLAAASDTTATLNKIPITVEGVRWKDEDHVSRTGGAGFTVLSAESITEFPGDPGTTVWALLNGSEGTDVTVIPVAGSSDGVIRFPTVVANVHYQHLLRIQPESFWSVDFVGSLDATADLTAKFGFQVQDTGRAIGVGFSSDGAASVEIRFADFVANTFITTSGAGPAFSANTLIDVQVRKLDALNVGLYVNGSLIDIQLLTAFPVFGTPAPGHSIEFGSFGTPGFAALFDVKQIGFHVETGTDYWTSRGAAAAVAAGDPDAIDVNLPSHFVAGDVGKRIITFGGITLNAQGGTNNGIFEIESVDTDEIVTVKGKDETGGQVQSATPTVFEVPLRSGLFLFPDDLGKEVVISGSSQGNDGAFVITTMFREGTTTDLSTGLTPVPERTNKVAMSAATFVTELGLTWRMDPLFVTEASLNWEMSSAGSNVGAALTLRQSLPITTGGYTRVLEALYTEVLSSQILEDDDVVNQVISTIPLLYESYPFYVADPLGFIRTYLDALTAAGVIPDFEGL